MNFAAVRARYVRTTRINIRGRSLMGCPHIINTMAVTKHCGQCKSAFDVLPHRKDAARFCGRKCFGLSLKSQTGANARFWNGGGVAFVCEWCKSATIVKKSRLNRTTSPRFCSLVCATNFRDALKTLCVCEICGKGELVKPSRKKSYKYCSKDCRHKADSINKRGDNNPLWNGGVTATQASKNWQKKNPDKRRENGARRRARKANAPEVETIDRLYVIRRDESTCYLCKKKVEPDEIHLDHVMPLIRGGSHTYENLKVSCRFCNQSKHDKTLEEYLTWRGFAQ